MHLETFHFPRCSAILSALMASACASSSGEPVEGSFDDAKTLSPSSADFESTDCLGPDSLDYVVARGLLPPTSVLQMDADSEHLYFRTADRIFRVELSGGEPQELYRDWVGSPHLTVREQDVLLTDRQVLRSLDKTGGQPAQLGLLYEPPSQTYGGRLDFVLEGDTAYAKSDHGDESGDFGPEEATFFKTDLETLESTVLASSAVGWNRPFAKHAGDLFVATTDYERAIEVDGREIVPSLLYRIPTTVGSPQVVPIDVPEDLVFWFDVIGTDDGGILLDVSVKNRDGSVNPPERNGIYHVSFDGGPLEQLASVADGWKHQIEHMSLAGYDILRIATGEETIYALKSVEGTPKPLVCFTDLQTTAITGWDHTIYLAIFEDGADGSAAVIRIELPEEG